MRRSTSEALRDFAADGIDIQTAMIRHVRSNPDRSTRSDHILWNGQAVWTTFAVAVPKVGELSIEFLSEPRESAQGVDVKAEDGAITLPGGGVQILRTWHDSCYVDAVKYPYRSEVGRLKIWNVYRRPWPNGQVTEEKWTGNSGLLVQQEADARWLFRCSDGPSEVPDFGRLVFRFSIS